MRYASEWYNQARAEFSPAELDRFFKLRDAGLATYRANVKAAIDAYHETVGNTWRKYDRVPVSTLCQTELNLAWEVFKIALATATSAHNMVPAEAYRAVKNGKPTITETIMRM